MKKITKQLLSTMLILAMVVVSMATGMTKQAEAAVNEGGVSSNYLNSSEKYLYLGGQGVKTYNFNINKQAMEKGATYSWYVKTDKGNPDSVTINEKTGMVTAKEAGTAYIRCKVTFVDGTILRPEARVTVRNNIKEVEINNLPENLSISAGSTYNFNRSILDTFAGKEAKTQGITRWEVAEDTVGVEAATNYGIVLPTKAGEFNIRAVCFQSTNKYKSWLANKEANTTYVTAASEWVTIKVTSSSGEATATTQAQLNKLLKEDSITQITLSTEKALTFTIPKGDYSKKTLIVNAANSDVQNYGSFKEITINAIKNSTWVEYTNGNIIYLRDDTTGFVVDNDVAVKRIVVDRANSLLNIEVKGIVEQIVVLQPSEIHIKGSGKQVPVSVEQSAGGSEITTSMPLKLELKAKTDIILNQGSEETTLDKNESKIIVKVENYTKKDRTITTNNSGGEAIGVGETVISGETIITTNPTTNPSTPVTPTEIALSAINAITGTAQVGVPLSAGTLSPAGANVSYQWRICETVNGTYTNILGATASAYTPVAGDLGKYIKVMATGTGIYSGTVTSNATGAVVQSAETAAVEAINAASTVGMNTVITTNAATLGLTLTDYTALTNKAPVHTALNGKSFADKAAVKAAFDTAVGNQKTAEATLAAAVGAINTANVADMGTAITINAATLELVLNDYTALTNKSPVHTALAGKSFMDKAAVKVAFDIAVGNQKITEDIAAAETAAIGAINAANTAGMNTAITTNAAVLGLVLTDYTALTNKEPVHTALTGKSFSDKAAVKAAFDIAVGNQKTVEATAAAETAAVGAINSASTAGMGTAITTNAVILGLVLTDYTALTNKAPVHTALTGQSFADKAAVKSAYDTAVGIQKAVEATAAAIAADNAAIAAAKSALEIAATLNPVQGTDANVVNMVQTILAAVPAAAGVTITVSDASGNIKLGADGSITFTGAAVTGNVIFTLNKGLGTQVTLTMSVVVPANDTTAAMQMVTVTNLVVEDTIGSTNNGIVTVRWSELTSGVVTDTSASGYEIYYIDNATLGSNTLTKDTLGAIKVDVPATNVNLYTVTGLTGGTVYTFVIYAVNSTTKSLVSNAVSGTPLDFIAGTLYKYIGSVSIEDDAALAALTSTLNGKVIHLDYHNGLSTAAIQNSITTRDQFLTFLESRSLMIDATFNEQNQLVMTIKYPSSTYWITVSSSGSYGEAEVKEAFFGSNPTIIPGTEDQN